MKHSKCEVKSFFFFFFLQMLKCIELDEKLKSMDQEITVNPQFVQKVRVNDLSCHLVTLKWLEIFIVVLWFVEPYN